MFCAPVNVCKPVHVRTTLEAQARQELGLCPGCQEKTQGQVLFSLYRAPVLRPATEEELFAILPGYPSVER